MKENIQKLVEAYNSFIEMKKNIIDFEISLERFMAKEKEFKDMAKAIKLLKKNSI